MRRFTDEEKEQIYTDYRLGLKTIKEIAEENYCARSSIFRLIAKLTVR